LSKHTADKHVAGIFASLPADESATGSVQKSQVSGKKTKGAARAAGSRQRSHVKPQMTESTNLSHGKLQVADEGDDATADDAGTPIKNALLTTEKDRLARTAFVGNIPIDVRRAAILKHFSQFGSVETVRIRSAASANLKMQQRAAVITGTIDREVRDSVNAYIVFTEVESVRKAIAEANGSFTFGRHLRVDDATPSGRPATEHQHKRSVFLGNLPFDCQEETLWLHFGGCGTIKYVRLVRDHFTQQGKGFGYVCFADKSAVESALELHESLINQRPVRVFRCSAGKAHARLSLAAGAGGREGAGRARWEGESAAKAGAAISKKLTQQKQWRKQSAPAKQKKGRLRSKQNKVKEQKGKKGKSK